MKAPSKNRDDSEDDRATAWAAGLGAKYNEVAEEPLPDKFRELLEQLEDADSRD